MRKYMLIYTHSKGQHPKERKENEKMKKYKVYFRAVGGTPNFKLSQFTQKPVSLEKAKEICTIYANASDEYETKVKEV